MGGRGGQGGGREVAKGGGRGVAGEGENQLETKKV
jgi:hypothetical protein